MMSGHRPRLILLQGTFVLLHSFLVIITITHIFFTLDLLPRFMSDYLIVYAKMTSHFLFLTGNDSLSIVQRLDKLKDDKNYKELYISLIYIDEMVANAIVDVLRSNDRKWDGVHLAHCTGQVEVVITNALALGSVQKITLLPDSDHMNDKCLYALANGLRVNKSVKSLVLRVNLSKQLAIALAEGLGCNSALEDLSLLLSASDRYSIAALARGIQRNTKLRSLKLNQCSLEDGHVSDLVLALDSHPSLLDLSVQGRCCRSKGIIAISSLLKSDSKKLIKLDLSNQQELAIETFAVSFLASALPTNTTLKFLDLSSNRLNDGDVTSLAAALEENSALEELRLVNCNVSDRSATTLANHLPFMRGLKSLWLYGNPFDMEGAKNLLEAVRGNSNLGQLLIPRGRRKTMDEIQRDIEYYLILNRGGRKLLQNVGTSPGLWPRVLNRAGSVHWDYFTTKSAQADIIYILLQGPALLER
jgi:Ran GTPase-activating protein (RanGAP) involved in mRNA processing and transport